VKMYALSTKLVAMSLNSEERFLTYVTCNCALYENVNLNISYTFFQRMLTYTFLVFVSCVGSTFCRQVRASAMLFLLFMTL